MGRLIEEITGQSLYQFLSENIFKPLEMKDTHFQLPRNKLDRLTSVYAYDENDKVLNERKNWSSDRLIKKNREAGGGGLVSTTLDYINFCVMLLNDGVLKGKQIISKQSIEKMTENQIGDLNYPWGRELSLGSDFS